MFCSRVGFSGTADLMALFSIRANSRWRPLTSWIISNGSRLTIYLYSAHRAVIFATPQLSCNFYRAMHFSAKRGIVIACRLSVCLSAIRPSVTLVDCDHIGWNSSKIITPLVSLGCSVFATPTWRVCSKGNTSKFGPKVYHPLLIWASETFDRKLRPNGYRRRRNLFDSNKE